MSTKAQKASTKAQSTSTTSTINSPLNIFQTQSDCNCGQCQCCNQQETMVCITFNTSALQNLVNLFPKFQITTNTNTCCDECGHPSHDGECPNAHCDCK